MSYFKDLSLPHDYLMNDISQDRIQQFETFRLMLQIHRQTHSKLGMTAEFRKVQRGQIPDFSECVVEDSLVV